MAGQIDEQGYMNGMNKKGFNSSRALSELYANSIDAGATKIVAKIDRDYIYIIDDGSGMDISGHEKLWVAQKENHSGDRSTGVSDSVQNHLLKYFQRIQQYVTFQKKIMEITINLLLLGI